jgi:hypothetical protein
MYGLASAGGDTFEFKDIAAALKLHNDALTPERKALGWAVRKIANFPP